MCRAPGPDAIAETHGAPLPGLPRTAKTGTVLTEKVCPSEVGRKLTRLALSQDARDAPPRRAEHAGNGIQQQLPRYETTPYAPTSLARLLTIGRALGLNVRAEAWA